MQFSVPVDLAKSVLMSNFGETYVKENRAVRTDGRTDRGPRFSAARRMCGTGKRDLPAVGAIRRSLRSIRDNFANVGSTGRCRLGKRWPRRGSRGLGRPQAADFEGQTLQVEAMKSGGWVAEREEAEEEEEIQKLKRPLSIFGLSPPPTCTTSDERHCTQCGGSREGGQFWMD